MANPGPEPDARRYSVYYSALAISKPTVPVGLFDGRIPAGTAKASNSAIKSWYARLGKLTVGVINRVGESASLHLAGMGRDNRGISAAGERLSRYVTTTFSNDALLSVCEVKAEVVALGKSQLTVMTTVKVI